MKYYDKLIKLKCFSFEDAEKMCGSSSSAKSMLREYKNKGYVANVKRNLYVVLDLGTHEPTANKFEIASHITKNSYITHHSAFEYYGYSNQVYYEVYVSGTRFHTFEFGDITYRYIYSPNDFGVVSPSALIKTTDKEKTLLAGIKDFEKIGGLEELLKCIDSIPYIDQEKTLTYLRKYNSHFLFQKTGYILWHFKDNLSLDDSFFDVCKNHVSKNKYYLSKEVRLNPQKALLNKEWNLIVPNNFEDMLSKGAVKLADL